MAYFCAAVPVVRLPGSSNTVRPAIQHREQEKRPFMSGTLMIHGSLETSSQTIVYSVSAFGAVTSWTSACRISRSLANCPIGALLPSGAATLVDTRRVNSMVTSG